MVLNLNRLYITALALLNEMTESNIQTESLRSGPQIQASPAMTWNSGRSIEESPPSYPATPASLVTRLNRFRPSNPSQNWYSPRAIANELPLRSQMSEISLPPAYGWIPPSDKITAIIIRILW